MAIWPSGHRLQRLRHGEALGDVVHAGDEAVSVALFLLAADDDGFGVESHDAQAFDGKAMTSCNPKLRASSRQSSTPSPESLEKASSITTSPRCRERSEPRS